MRVKATKLGYYRLVRRKEGDVFDLMDPSHFSKKWMTRVNQEAEKTPAPGEPLPGELNELPQQASQSDDVKDSDDTKPKGKGKSKGKSTGDQNVIG